MIQGKRRGFTIVELLIVIVIIAILAAITIISYSGIAKRAKKAALETNAKNAATAMESSYAVNNTYPLSLDDSSVARIKNTQDVSFSLHSKGSSYCLTATSSDEQVESVYITNSNTTPTDGQCPEELGVSVSTAAGTGTLGFSNGTGTAAAVASPAALVADSAGNMYFTDGSTSRIRKLTTAGVVSTLAGNGSSGYVEGTGTAATFNWPQALTLLPDGTLLIADSNNHKIRTLSTSTTTSGLFAGGSKGTGGSVGSTSTSVQFDTPRGIVYDASSGNIYVADSQNNRIIKLNSSGTVLAIYGQTTGAFADGNGTAARFNYPEGLAVDNNGIVYVADTQNQRIRKIDTAGNVTTIAGNGTAGFADGNGTAAQFKSPGALTVSSSGVIYVADTQNQRIRKIDTAGNVTTIAGSGTAGFADDSGTSAMFNGPNSIVIASDGKLYVCDTANHRIRVLSI